MNETPESPDNDFETPDIREDEHEAIAGVILPLLFVILAVTNMVTGIAWSIGRNYSSRSFIITITHPVAVTGFIVMELALALGLFAWFWMANRERYDQYVVFVQIGSVVLGFVSLILICTSFFV